MFEKACGQRHPRLMWSCWVSEALRTHPETYTIQYNTIQYNTILYYTTCFLTLFTDETVGCVVVVAAAPRTITARKPMRPRFTPQPRRLGMYDKHTYMYV